jgi:hypothetical protein
MDVLPFSLEACRRREPLREWRVIDSEEGEVTRRRELNKDNDMDEEGRSIVEEGPSGSIGSTGSGSTGGTGGSMGEGSTGGTGGSIGAGSTGAGSTGGTGGSGRLTTSTIEPKSFQRFQLSGERNADTLPTGTCNVTDGLFITSNDVRENASSGDVQPIVRSVKGHPQICNIVKLRL